MVAAVDGKVTMNDLKGIYVALFAESGSQHGARTEKYKGEEGRKKLNTLIDGLRHRRWAEAAGGVDWIGTRQRAVVRRLQLTGVGAGMGGGGGREEG